MMSKVFPNNGNDVNHRPIHIYSRCLTSVHIASNHVAADKHTTANGGTFMVLRAQPVSEANYVKARQSLIEHAVM